MTRHLKTFDDLQAAVGHDLGSSNWFAIEQQRVDLFGQAINDLQWIHVDPDRGRRDSPFGCTIAHGMLVLALISDLRRQITGTRFELPVRMELFYGINKVRFVSPVKVGARIRVHLKIVEARLIEPEVGHVVYEHLVEIEGETRPALVAETIGRIYLA